MRIAVDIDDTLYSFSQLARRVFAERANTTGDKRYQRGSYLSWVEWRSPADVLGLEVWLDIIDECHSPENISRQVAFPGAAQVLGLLHRQGAAITYISNRNPEVYRETYDWLRHEEFPTLGTELVCTMDDKAPFLYCCDCLIDDRPKTLVQFVYDSDQPGRKAFGIFGEHNRSLTDVPGIYLAPNWTLLQTYLEEKGVLEPAAVS